MKKIFKILIFPILLSFNVVLFNGCNKEELEPRNIFIQEDLSLTNSEGIELKGFPGADVIFINEGSYEETETGYHIMGTIFGKSEDAKKKYGIISPEGAFAVAGGEFNIDVDKGTGTVTMFAGRGAPFLPDEGIFGYIKNDLIPSVDFMYETGKTIKAQPGQIGLPLLDDVTYFGFELNNMDKWDASLKLGKVKILPKALYLDIKDPMFYARADVSVGKIEVNDARIGLSAHGQLEFKPRDLSPIMEEVVGGTAFEPFLAHMMIGAEIPLEKLFKIPVAVDGEVYIKSGETGKEMDYYENGAEADFEIGVNGKVKLSSKALDFLPAGVEFVIGDAVLQYKNGTDDDFIAIAGQMGNEKDLSFILDYIPDKVKEVIPLPYEEIIDAYSNLDNQHKGVYLEIRSVDNWEFFFETKSSLELPGLTLRETQLILGVSPSGISVYAKDEFPFGLSEVELIGNIDYEGNFYFKASDSKCFPELVDGLELEFNRWIEASNMDFTGIKIHGDLTLPYGIGAVKVDGEITTDCLAMTGIINSKIDFGGGVEFPTVDMYADISTCRGVKLKGVMDIPYGIAYVDVEGELTSRGIGLSGKFSSDIDFGGGVRLPAIDMVLSASTWDGVYLKGVLDVPYGIAHVDVEGGFNSSGLTLSGMFETAIDFGNGFQLPALAMQLSASTDPSEGISFLGKLEIPGNFGKIQVEGELSTSDIRFAGEFDASLDLGFTTIGSDLIFDISTKGIKIEGSQNFPFGLGDIDVEGEIYTNGDFSLAGAYTYDLDFGIIELEAGIKVRVSSSDIKFSAYGKGTIDFGLFETSYSMGVDINPNWETGSCELCIDFALGDACIDIPDDLKKMKRIGPMTVKEWNEGYAESMANPVVKKYKN